MNYGTFQNMNYIDGKRVWPEEIQKLLDIQKCFTLDKEPFDGTGHIKWNNDQTISDVNVTPVIDTDADGRKFWLQHYLNDEQDVLNTDKAEFQKEIDGKQSEIDVRQRKINLL